MAGVRRADATRVAQHAPRGPLMGIAPTNKQVKVQGITITRVSNGKIVEEFESYDALGMMRQIGAVPATVGKAA
ncbi:MAG: ester cyclase [Terriglobales bacterium]